MNKLIECKNICKSYPLDTRQLAVLHHLSFDIHQGEFVAIMGASGSGKSTLLNIIGLLDKPSTGQYFLQSQDTQLLDEDEMAEKRNQSIGFVFQQFYLLSRLTAFENINLALSYNPAFTGDSHACVQAKLEKVGMGNFATRYPNQLSGGQQQRIAVARALINEPKLILADEPTGSLDSKTGRDIMQLFVHLNEVENKTVIIVTHNEQIAKQCHRVLRLEDGKLI